MKLHAMRNQKGFTLVELIVVLVILAILAVLLVPALTGYIDRAKEKQIVAETRQAVIAAQTLVSTNYGDGVTAVTGSAAAELAETKSGVTFEFKYDAGKVIALKLTDNGKTCYYDGTTYVCADADPASYTAAVSAAPSAATISY